MGLGIPVSVTWPSAALYAVSAAVVGVGSVAVYRSYFHPLAKVPGPFLPAVTRLYLWYHNVVKDGTYYKKIDEMHAKYGMHSAPSMHPQSCRNPTLPNPVRGAGVLTASS
jgi:hypothetical protein